MLKKRQKITRKLFPKFTDKKIIWNGLVLRVSCYKKNRLNSQTRFTVVVSKKQYSTTVARNLFKRRVFSVLQKRSTDFTIFQFDRYVISPKIPIEKIKNSSINEDIKQLILECSK